MSLENIVFITREYSILKKLKGGRTNSVLLCQDILTGDEVVIKKPRSNTEGESLQREIDFFGYIADNEIEGFPKLFGYSDDGKEIMLEFKNGVNGKDIVEKLTPKNWKKLGTQMGKVLKDLHSIKIGKTENEKEKYISEMLKYMEWGNSEENLEELRVMCEKYVGDFCLIHGDFSPHNCLFTKKENGEYTLGSVLDPSGRTSFGMAEFDIAYALNNRWIIDKESFEKGFIEEYNFDINSDLFSKLEEVMKSYLKTLYKHLAEEEIKKRELKNVKTAML